MTGGGAEARFVFWGLGLRREWVIKPIEDTVSNG